MLEKRVYSELNLTNEIPSIPEYYKGKSVFITGGTGKWYFNILKLFFWDSSQIQALF